VTLGRSFKVAPASAYAVAVVAVLVAAGIRWFLAPVLGPQLPFTIFFAALIWAAWYGGIGPGALAVILSFFAAEFLFVGPSGSLAMSRADLVSGLAFLVVGMSSVILSGSLHRTQVGAQETERQRRDQLASLADDASRLRRAEERARLLADASRLLTQSLDYDKTLDQVADLAVPQLSDWCFVDLIEPDGSFRKVAIRCSNPEKQWICEEVRKAYIPDATRPHPIQQTLRTREPELVAEMTDAWLESRARDARHLELLRAMNMKSLMAIPLIAQKELLGVITLASSESERSYSRIDLQNGEALAIHISLAITNSRLYQDVQDELRERKVAEQALRDSEGRFRTLVTATGAMVWRVAPDGRAIDEPTGWEQVTGQPYAELAADPGGWFSRVHPADVARVRNVWNQAQAANHMVDVEFRLRRRDGTYRRMHTVGVPLLSEAGDILEWIGTTIDIHDRREAEEQLHQAQRIETVGRLAGGMAHETNNQMMVVQSFIEFLLRAPNLTEEQRQDLQTVEEAAERVSGLTRQLLALSRRQVLDTRVLDLDSIVIEAESVLRQTLGPEVRLSVQFEPGQKWVVADRNQLVQVMVNLALNARDAISGTGELTISTRQADRGPPGGRLGSVWPDSGVALLSVADTGAGIQPALLGRIFEPFFTTKPTGQGSGLGLPVVEGIVSQSEGDIWVESKPGYGTVVTVGLPLTTEPEVAIPRHPPGNGRNGTERVLVVDDEEQVRRLLVRGLQQGGYQVIEASGGQEAIAILEQEEGRIQLVVSDIAMPDMSGVELAERIRSDWPALPVLFVSGHPYNVVALDQATIESDRFLQKPFKVDTMLAVVRNALDEIVRPH
jgi:PAS domain S-box-containing protein